MDKQQARDLIKKTFEQLFDKVRFTAPTCPIPDRIDNHFKFIDKSGTI
jgi:hypothetical protein